MKLVYKFDPKSKYVVAVSFGPDSMALLNMLILDKVDVVVAHVNYHRRPESNFEEVSLRKFCEEHKIPIEVLDTNGLKPDKNFQAWARKIRYDFFKKVSDKYSAKGVLVAHQEDDVIETYIMQKQRGNVVKNWGIAEEIDIYGVHIIRPLLSFSKKMLQDYCDYNEVPYAIDSSNLENHYARNLIRHTIVENMSDLNREKIIQEIKDNQARNKQVEVIDYCSKTYFENLSDEDVVLLIANFIESRDEHVDISNSFVKEIRKAFLSDKSNVLIPLDDRFIIAKEYDDIYLIDNNDLNGYSIVIEKAGSYEDENFIIDFREGEDERNIKASSYPLTIKPVTIDDTYHINDYECSVRRLLIDWKVPLHLRVMWPGIYDKDGNLIYIPRYRKEFRDEHKSKFVIKFTK